MTTLRRLEARLRAWKSFRGIARASRTLAAVQALQWAEHQRRAHEYQSWCATLAATHGTDALSSPGPRITIGIGTDLGLCGPLNARIANSWAALDHRAEDMRLAVGERLAANILQPDTILFSAPTSFAAVEQIAAEIGAVLEPLPAQTTPLRIVVTTAVETDGHPVVDVLDGFEGQPARARFRFPAELSPPGETRATAAILLRRARIIAALARGALSEAEARLRTMTRAHDAADRRIEEQERDVRKLRQEAVTQEMIEVRLGSTTAWGEPDYVG